MKSIKEMSQVGYERLLNTIASALQTQRRFIKIETEEYIEPAYVRYKVKRRGEFHRYLVTALEVGNRVIFKNVGVII